MRDHLLATLTALRDPNTPMDINRAKAVAEVATVLVNSAKVEVDYMKVTRRSTGAYFHPALPGGK